VPFQSTGPSWADLQPQLQAGFVFLLATIPVGVLFGLLTTRGVIQRLRRLAAGTVGFASGDFGQRVPESGVDEVGQLERHFNSMASRLEEAIAQQRALAERNARLAERTRISRELHDSISQDLFSMSAIVAGLRKALPNSSPVQAQLDTLTGTVNSTIQEMRALLLELRPTALEEKGLIPALTDLCQAYETRVGVRVSARLEQLTLAPAVEQALFRIAQEGLSNAVRHSEAEEILVTLRPIGEQAQQAELTVVDNGRGFDPAQAPAHGLGLKLMAERVRELGGSLAVDSSERAGTTIRVVLPAPDAA
jgi:signal transduction histidine kinase